MFNWNAPSYQIGIFILIIWEAFWKAIGLWKSAKRGELWWFLGIFLVNFVGIIPIFYLWKTKQLKGVLQELRDFFRSKFRK